MGSSKINLSGQSSLVFSLNILQKKDDKGGIISKGNIFNLVPFSKKNEPNHFTSSFQPKVKIDGHWFGSFWIWGLNQIKNIFEFTTPPYEYTMFAWTNLRFANSDSD